ncbi:hypothetical protein CPB86DRAFT_795743 [Serendipita vermifera]|nr:hypothetical protein CPB86DRAFT_795743 [Serendipita vermifera]
MLYSIFAVVQGEISIIRPIKLDETETIGELRKQIREEKMMLRAFDADALNLYRADVAYSNQDERMRRTYHGHLAKLCIVTKSEDKQIEQREAGKGLSAVSALRMFRNRGCVRLFILFLPAPTTKESWIQPLHLPPMSNPDPELYTIFCVLDVDPETPFDVKIPPSETLAELKRLIARERPDLLKTTIPATLRLYRMDIEATTKPGKLKETMGKLTEEELLSPGLLLSDIYSSSPPVLTFHVAVLLPSSKLLAGIATSYCGS